jgi:hypothetical protein
MRLIASVSVGLVMATLLAAPALASSDSAVSVIGEQNWSTVPTLPDTLAWREQAHLNAREAIDAQVKILEGTLENFRDAGATAVVVKRIVPERTRFWKQTTKNAFKSMNIVGLDSKGIQVTSSGYLPLNNVFFASTLIRLASGNCSLRAFDLWDWSTWFETRCEIVEPTTQQLLDAHYKDLVGQGVGDRRDMLAWELKKLEYVLENKLNYRIQGNKLICPELKRLSVGTDRVWLTNLDYVWDYKISINRANWSASLEYLGPRPTMFAKKFEGDLMDYLDTPNTDS